MILENKYAAGFTWRYWLAFAVLAFGVLPLSSVVVDAADNGNDAASLPQTTTPDPSRKELHQSSDSVDSKEGVLLSHNHDHDRRIAERVIRSGGLVTVRLENGREIEFDLLAYLPKDRFELVGIAIGTGKYTGAVHHEYPTATPIDGAILKDIHLCTKLRVVRLRFVNVTDGGLAEFSTMTGLTELDLNRANLYGDGLVHLRQLTNLKRLSLAKNPISDASLEHIAELPNLEQLYMYDIPITDASIKHLKKLKSLKYLDLRHTLLSMDRSGLADLRMSLPACTIRAN